jgi:hypothetical protein
MGDVDVDVDVDVLCVDLFAAGVPKSGINPSLIRTEGYIGTSTSTGTGTYSRVCLI